MIEFDFKGEKPVTLDEALQFLDIYRRNHVSRSKKIETTLMNEDVYEQAFECVEKFFHTIIDARKLPMLLDAYPVGAPNAEGLKQEGNRHVGIIIPKQFSINVIEGGRIQLFSTGSEPFVRRGAIGVDSVSLYPEGEGTQIEPSSFEAQVRAIVAMTRTYYNEQENRVGIFSGIMKTARNLPDPQYYPNLFPNQELRIVRGLDRTAR
jgi:hypothetical protein